MHSLFISTILSDCKEITMTQSTISQTSGTLYPALELKKMSLSMSMTSSTNSSTLMDGYMSSCSTEGAVALEPVIEPVTEIERERAPYCVPSEGWYNHYIYFTIDF